MYKRMLISVSILALAGAAAIAGCEPPTDQAGRRRRGSVRT